MCYVMRVKRPHDLERLIVPTTTWPSLPHFQRLMAIFLPPPSRDLDLNRVLLFDRATGRPRLSPPLPLSTVKVEGDPQDLPVKNIFLMSSDSNADCTFSYKTKERSCQRASTSQSYNWSQHFSVLSSESSEQWHPPNALTAPLLEELLLVSWRTHLPLSPTPPPLLQLRARVLDHSPRRCPSSKSGLIPKDPTYATLRTMRAILHVPYKTNAHVTRHEEMLLSRCSTVV